MEFKFDSKDRQIPLHYFDENGEYTHTLETTIFAHTGLPANTTLKALSELNQGEKAYFIDGDWLVTPYFIGRTYFDEYANKCAIKHYPFEISEFISFDEPLPEKDGFFVKLVKGQWVYLVDNIGRTAYSKQGFDDFYIEDNQPLPDTHTAIERPPFSVWDESASRWLYQRELELEFKTHQEREWRNEELTKVLSRIDQYEKDQSYPVELQTSPLTQVQYMSLLRDRKALSGYPQSSDFPFGERPQLESEAQ